MEAEPGDHVDIDEPIAQVETDKVFMTFVLHIFHTISTLKYHDQD